MNATATPPLPQQFPPSIDGGDRLLAVLCHVSFFIGLGFLLPLIVYLTKRHDSEFVATHAREVLNFHISLVIYFIGAFVMVFLFVGIFAIIGLALMAFVCAIIGAARASDCCSRRMMRQKSDDT